MQYDAQNYYLDVSDALTADGSLLGVHPSNTAAAQKFKIVKKQENTYAIYTGPTNYEKLLDGQYDAGNEILLSKDVKQNSEGAERLQRGSAGISIRWRLRRGKNLSAARPIRTAEISCPRSRMREEIRHITTIRKAKACSIPSRIR